MPPTTDSTVRIPLLTQEKAKEVAAEAGVSELLASLNVFRALLHQPGLAKAVAGVLNELLRGRALDPRLRELVIMRLGWKTGSVYEWTQHWRVARSMGMSEEEILGVRDWRNHGAYGNPERCVLAATDECVDAGAVQPATWAACEAEFGDPAVLLELVAAIGNWRFVSSLLQSLQIPLEDGVAAWPPDGQVPPAAEDG